MRQSRRVRALSALAGETDSKPPQQATMVVPRPLVAASSTRAAGPVHLIAANSQSRSGRRMSSTPKLQSVQGETQGGQRQTSGGGEGTASPTA
jgi:hypothetical protein